MIGTTHHIEITAQDLRTSSHKSPTDCAIAKAFKRAFGAKQVVALEYRASINPASDGWLVTYPESVRATIRRYMGGHPTDPFSFDCIVDPRDFD